MQELGCSTGEGQLPSRRQDSEQSWDGRVWSVVQPNSHALGVAKTAVSRSFVLEMLTEEIKK